MPPSGSFGSGDAGGTGGGLGGVDKALGTATKAAGGAATAIGVVKTEAKELARTLQQNVAQNLGSMFAGLITGATTLKQSIGSVIARLGELALTRGFETLLAGVGFGTGPLGQIAGFLFGATPRAAGGPVTAGRPYLVGERGPELIVPRAPGQVIPNHALGSGSGGGGPDGNPHHRRRRPRQCRDPGDGRGGDSAGAPGLRRAARRPGSGDRRRSPLPRMR